MNEDKLKKLTEDINEKFKELIPKGEKNAFNFYHSLREIFFDYFNPKYEKQRKKDFTLNIWLNCENLLKALREKDFYKTSEILLQMFLSLDDIKWEVQNLKKATDRLMNSSFNKAYRLNKNRVDKTKNELFELMSKILKEKNINKKKKLTKEYSSKYRVNEILSDSGKKEDEIFFIVKEYGEDLLRNKKFENEKIFAKDLDKEIKKALKIIKK